jgi:hypothetical protein
MGLELGVCNRMLPHISKIVIEKYLKIIYEEGSKISKYAVSFCVIPLHHIFTVLLYGS